MRVVLEFSGNVNEFRRKLDMLECVGIWWNPPLVMVPTLMSMVSKGDVL